MTTYICKPYQKGIETALARIDLEVGRDWAWPGGHTLEQWMEITSQENFDPESIYLAYLGDELAAYSWSYSRPTGEDGATRASLVYPKALPGHEAAVPLLIEHALEVLQQKGLNQVAARASTMCVDSFEILEETGFQVHPVHGRGSKVYYIYDLEKGKLNVPVDKVMDFDLQRDLDEAAELAKIWYRQPVAWCKEYLAHGLNDEFSLFAHLVVREGDKMVAACAAAPNYMNGGDPAAIYYIYARDAECLRPIIVRMIEISIEAGYKKLLVDLINDHRGFEADYQAMGFRLAAEFANYVKNLS